jgi:Glucose / Sorbosone dehydrogenase
VIWRALAVAGLFAVLAVGPARAATLVPVGTFDQPMQVIAPPGDTSRIFVVEKTGAIRVVKNGTTLATPFLDLSALLPAPLGYEQGVQSMAFPLDYAASGRFYVFFTPTAPTAPATGDIEIDEFRVSTNPDVADPASRRRVLAINHQLSEFHYGGQLATGPDGMLWVSTGDAAGLLGDPDGNAQNPTSLLGKILRMDPREGQALPPADNPFAGGGGHPLVWATGLRNPYRFSFDRTTGDLIIGDVGHQQVDEVNFTRRADGLGRGANYGWNLLEGRYTFNLGTPTALVPATSFPASYKAPLIEVPLAGPWCALIGGHVVRAADSDLADRYVYGDNCTGELWAVDPAAAAVAPVQLPNVVAGLTGFGEDGCGRLYAASSTTGQVLRVEPPAQCSVAVPLFPSPPAPPPAIPSTTPPAAPQPTPPADRAPPNIRVISANATQSRVRLRLRCSEPCSLRITGIVSTGARRSPLKATERRLADATARFVDVPLPRAARRLVARPVRSRARLTVRAVDGAGNVGIARTTVAVRRPR